MRHGPVVLLLLLGGCGSAIDTVETGEAVHARSCLANDDCGNLQFCDKPAGACGATGTCRPRGINLYCVQTSDPVCGCDGRTFDNACLAHKAGISIDHAGGCEVATTPTCDTDADCYVFAVPKLCRVCDDGSQDCMHWACLDGQCQMQLCGPRP